ncbi:hypothetical protein FJ974_05035 [Mesorhizobium sp. B1-1-8]|nr:hypothetical protein [Mesorhizobium sp. B1-1-8]UCI10346.1 hypothetical protein FJ974_05035 [Mesorhizobium sp. B1-1-8]
MGGNALSDRRQSRIRHDQAQFPQPSPAPPLAHHSHPLGGCSHFGLPCSANSVTVTRYVSCGNPFHDKDTMVTACGRICMMRKKINVLTVLAGQRLGIKEVDDGIWLVSFMHYDLGYVDLEQRTLQTIDNPFGTRLSPMS